MPSDFQLRAPTPDDLSKLARLGRDTFIETFGPLYTPEDLNTFLQKVHSEKTVAEELADPKLTHRVIDSGQDLVAFIKIGPVHVPVENPAPDAMEIWQIYVRREFISHGFGKQLMAWADEEFQKHKAGDIYVSVFSENDRAIRFYQRHGFQKIGEYDFPVGDQIDLEWIMLRPALASKNH
jgi:diamine N-acetyltransferase